MIDLSVKGNVSISQKLTNMIYMCTIF